ncbi:DUF732 domain-containing protein [Mycobacterium deserti]|uniref:DUF732 domain-containing protein n=1 Tax=Mycobacterium deserti TaxID=2978347 RepID=A0ABT2MEI8_9MYCO|nr:DUF732 domain-containing protein [Mycobacterium deserti]MCT7660689.1 DUF732 domain-containing protein [Mycobacterium deserti]
MAGIAVRTHLRVLAGALASAAAAGGLLGAAAARADATAYLVNVTVRPGYNFADADDALRYGEGICDKVTGGRTYADVVADVKADFAFTDEYSASYLITQAVNELCPARIWQLRQSTAQYPAIGR